MFVNNYIFEWEIVELDSKKNETYFLLKKIKGPRKERNL